MSAAAATSIHRFGEVQTLFQEVLERAPAGRDAFPRLFAEDPDDTPEPLADSCLGTRLGASELVRRTGAGGMGAVYEAVRADDQFLKRVAIKLLGRGASGDLAVERCGPPRLQARQPPGDRRWNGQVA